MCGAFVLPDRVAQRLPTLGGYLDLGFQTRDRFRVAREGRHSQLTLEPDMFMGRRGICVPTPRALGAVLDQGV
jgi:hypothetical protein